MRLGMCISSEDRNIPFEVGADYYEISASGELYGINECEYERLRKETLSQNRIRPYSTNGLISENVKLCGAEADMEKIVSYAENVFRRLSGLGIKMLVFGSGRSRHVPEGYPREKAYIQLTEAAISLSEIASKYGQTIAFEPLRRAECNMINTIGEGAAFVRCVNRDNFRLLVDFYHVSENGEGYEEIEKNADLIAHIHIASRSREVITGADMGYVGEIARLLKGIGYTDGISYEGKFDGDINSLRNMFSILREYF